MSSSKEMTARRALLRGRSTVTVATPQPHPNTETTTKATAVSRFIEVTRNALEALMQNHGYSRERAVSTLLEEIRSASAVNTTAIHHHHHHHPNSHPSDEIFKLMRLHNLGIEQTANAWKVAQALLLLQQQQQEPSDVNRSNKHSFEAALEHLTHRIANLRPPTTMQVTAAAATTTERPTNIAATPLPADAAAVPVPVRIVAVSNTPSMKDNATSVATTTHRSSKFKKSKCALTSTTTASTNKVNHAKEAQPLSRTRSDSVTEAVASKLTAAAAAIDSSSSKLTAVAGTVVNTNNKRSRNNSTSTTDSNVAGEGGVGIEGPLLSPSPSSSFGGTNAKRTRRANSMSNNNNNMNNSKVE